MPMVPPLLLALAVLALSRQPHVHAAHTAARLPGNSRMSAYRLQVEHMSAPLAVDSLQPQFSWSLQAAEGTQGLRQTAYRLVVVNRASGTVVADTQRVASSATVVSPLQLREEVDSDCSFEWSVEVWSSGHAAADDDDDDKVAVTTKSTFGTGLLTQDAWHSAQWIGSDSLLRTSFSMPADQSIRSGTVRIACPGYCVVTINGANATDAVLGHQTVYERTVLYDSYDVTALLKAGSVNVIGVEVGRGWYGSFEDSCSAVAPSATDCTAAQHGHSNPLKCLPYCWQQQPGQLGNRSLMMMLSVLGSSGSTTHIVSNSSTWRQSSGSLVYDDVYKGEVRDYRLAEEGWDTTGFDASHWQPATAAVPPGGDLAAAAYPPVRVINATGRQPVAVWQVGGKGSGRWMFDFGYNTAALIRLELPASIGTAAGAAGAAGTNITITTHEQLGANCSSRQSRSDCSNIGGGGPYPSTQTFILGGDNSSVAERRRVMQTRMTYFGYQYLQLECKQWADSALPPTGLVLTMLPISTDVETVGTITFHGEAAELLSKINAATLNSGRSNLVSVPTDCPTRERRGYLGDGQIAAETMSSYFEMASTYRHFLTTIKDAQNAVGAVPAKTPPYPPALYYNNDAGWTVGYPLIVQIMLRRYNDTQTVVKHYPHLLKLWQNVSSFVPSDGPYANLWLDVDRDGSWVNGDLGDWNALNDEWPLDVSKANQGHVPSALVATFWLIEFAKAMETFTYVVLQQQQQATGATTTAAGTATTAGSADGIDPSQFSRQASLSTKALHARFWNTTLRRYSVIGREPPASLSRFPHGNAHHPPSQTLQALPLWANLTPAADQRAAMTALTDSIEKTDYHLLTGIVGTKYILPTLAQHGKLDVAMCILTEVSQPSFGYWVGPENNLTTLMEDWRSSAAMAYGSKNHIMFGSEGAFLMEHVAGIRHHNNEDDAVLIAPQPLLVTQLTEVSATQELHAAGQIAVTWRKLAIATATSGTGGAGGIGAWEMEVSSPPGLIATIHLPLCRHNNSVACHLSDSSDDSWMVESITRRSKASVSASSSGGGGGGGGSTLLWDRASEPRNSDGSATLVISGPAAAARAMALEVKQGPGQFVYTVNLQPANDLHRSGYGAPRLDRMEVAATQSTLPLKMDDDRHDDDGWANSTVGVHTFLTFNSAGLVDKLKADPSDPRARNLDFIWGSDSWALEPIRAANSRTIISKYIPCCRDTVTPNGAAGLTNYTQRGWANRVLYKCDRKTPAYYDNGGAGRSSHTSIPLDFTNPDVVDWQLEKFARPAAVAGFDAMALDNVELENSWGACGVWQTPTKWVQMYTGNTSDPAFASDVAKWLGAIKAKVNKLKTLRGKPMKIIPNFSLHLMNWNDSSILAVGNASDGILSESGFLGGGYRGPGRPYDYIGSAWVQRIHFMRNLQRHGKAFYCVNAYGDHTSSKTMKDTCANDPHACISKEVRQWVLGSYLMGKEQAAAIALYQLLAPEGSEFGYGNWSWHPEWNAEVGVALGAPEESPAGLWTRRYSSAIVFVNPWPDRGSLVAQLPTPAAGMEWRDLYGHVALSHITMGPVTATTLQQMAKRLTGDTAAAGDAVQTWGALARAIALLQPATKTVTFTLGSGFTMTGYNGTAITIPQGCTAHIVSRASHGTAMLNAGSKGALFIADGSLQLTGFLIKNSLAKSNGGVLTVDAGGLATFTDCTFVNNTAPKGDGGVVHVHPNGSAVFTSCSFVNNSASAGGGAVDVYKGSARFDNCTFEEDRAGTDLRFNGVYNGGSVVFGCPTGTTGAVMRLYGNANTTQLPPAKQIVSCHSPPAPFKALKVDDSAATTDNPVADPAAVFVFGQAQETLQPARPVKSDDASAPPLPTDLCASEVPQSRCTPRGVFTSRNNTGQQIAGGANLPVVLFAEHFGTSADDWGDRINAAIQAAFSIASPATIQLPVGPLNVSVPIKLWRMRQTAHANTMASNVTPFANVGAVWESIKGGEEADLPRGFRLNGVAGGGYASSSLSTRLRWTGANDSVVIDLPAPWHCVLSDFMIDGAASSGVIGIRYRAGYEFQSNGGKSNVFERLSLFGLHVAMEIGGPLIPDLVGASIRNLEIHDVDVGLRFFGGNVAEMWVSECMLAQWRVAGIQLLGYSIRTARPRPTQAAEQPSAPPLRDADGREIFVEQLPKYTIDHDPAILACPPYCATGSPPGSREVGGGDPSVVIDRVVASGHVGWLVDSNSGAVRMQSVRLEGEAGIMRNTGLPEAWTDQCANATSTNCGPIVDDRFTDILIDVSNSYGSRPANGTAILYNKPGRLQLIGGSIGADVVVGNGTIVSDVGVRWQHGASIVQAKGTAGAKTFALQDEQQLKTQRGEVSALRAEVAELRDADASTRAEVGTLREQMTALREAVMRAANPSVLKTDDGGDPPR